MPPSQRDLSRSLARLSAAGVDTPATQAKLSVLAPNVAACCQDVRKLGAADLVACKASYHLGQMAVLPLRLLAAATLPDVPTEAEALTSTISNALSYVVRTCKAKGKDSTLPSELVAAWGAAARKVCAFVKPLCGRDPVSTRQQAPLPDAVAQLASSLLHLWVGMYQAAPYAAPLNQDVLITTADAAAELCLALLTCTPEEQAAQQQQAPDAFEQRQGHAAILLSLLAEMLSRKGPQCGASCGGRSPSAQAIALISDPVQEALALHLAVLTAFDYMDQSPPQAQQQPAGSGSSSSRPAAADGSMSLVSIAHRAWLQSAGFLPSHVWLYGTTIKRSLGSSLTQQGGGGGSGSSSARRQAQAGAFPVRLQTVALSALQHVMIARAAQVHSPGWQRRCRGAIAAASGPVDPEADPMLCLPAPGVDPVLLQLLVIELSCITCWDSDGGATVGAAMNLAFFLHRATPASQDKMEVWAVLQHLWLGLGQSLLLSCGTAAGDLEDEEEGEAAAAAAAAASGAAAAQQRPRVMLGLTRNNDTLIVPTDAAQQRKYVWSRFSTTLWRTFSWLEVYSPDLPTELFGQQPVLCSRVIEAAARASLEQTDLGSPQDHCKVLNGLARALHTCMDNKLPPEERELLFSRPSRASRHCSMSVSLLKLLEARPAVPGFQAYMFPYLFQAASYALLGAPVYKLAEQLQDSTATPASLPFLAGPAITGWLAVGGRTLVAAGQLMRLLPAWLAAPYDPVGPHHMAFLMSFDMVLSRIWALLAAMLEQLDTPAAAAAAAPSSAPAPATSAAAVRALQQQVEAYVEAYKPLTEMCLGAAAMTTGPAGLQAAFRALGAACAQPGGGMPAALQGVGAAICAAFPHRHGCNDPGCSNLEGLTESACASKKCSRCKVARYCCKEHQLRHWPAHKAVCKQLEAAQAGLAPAEAAAAAGTSSRRSKAAAG